MALVRGAKKAERGTGGGGIGKKKKKKKGNKDSAKVEYCCSLTVHYVIINREKMYLVDPFLSPLVLVIKMVIQWCIRV